MKLFEKKYWHLLFVFTALSLSFLLNSCGGSGGGSSTGEGGVFGPSVSGEPHLFRGAGVINDSKYLIGGPLAQGRVGDVLLQNDKVRVLIQKPRRNAGVALYGGNIIDADLTRGAGEKGRDTFGITMPLINVSWTPYYQRLEVLNADFTKGPVVLRASGVLNVYDYIQTSIIVPFARVAVGVQLFFPKQYNDILNPFQNMPKLRQISTSVVTDYVLRADRNYVLIQTHLMNNGSEPVPMPIGDWINATGTLETFVPKQGFTGQGLYSPSGGVPAVIFPAMETTVGVSYGYFYDPTLITKEDGTIHASDLLTVSGVSIVGYGEKVAPGLIPLSADADPIINFALPPGETLFVRYFAVGNGDVGSVLSGGLQAVGVSAYRLSGQVKEAGGQPVSNARVLALDAESKKPVAMFFSDLNGNFSGEVSAGADNKAKLFGSGQYTIEVYKEGYLDSGAVWPVDPADITRPQKYGSLAGKNKAGRCDLSGGNEGIVCTLGQTGLVHVTARDENGNTVPARVAVVGFDPSPYHKLPQGDNPDYERDDFSILMDIEFQQQQYGYMDAFFLNKSGEITNHGHVRYAGGNAFKLEPGNYEIFLMRGPEYSMHRQRITVAPGGEVNVEGTVKKVVNTAGYISGDFHIHGINSPDSPFGQEARVNFALAEGLDLMVSADHDAVTDYSKAIKDLGVEDEVISIPGMEITPMAFGHYLAFPLAYKKDDPTGGAFDYTQKEGFSPGPGHHELLSPEETLVRIDQQNSGEQVLQVNHIQDNLLGNFSLSGLLTSTKFDGVKALSTFGDPVQFRLPPNTNEKGGFQAPFPLGTSKLFTHKFTAVEICIGESAVVPLPHIMETALPTWFDLLNLGKKATATCSSDTHRQIREPIGVLRNYVVSSVDPRDGEGSYGDIDIKEIAGNINDQRVIVSAGPFVTVKATSPDTGESGIVGDLLNLDGHETVELEIHVESPDWMDWDMVEVYINTDPTPAKDDLSGPWDKSAKEFVTVAPPHLNPKFLYSPEVKFRRGGGDGAEPFTQTIAEGVRKVDLAKTFTLTEDSWIVVMVRGTDLADTIFPYAPKAVNTVAAELSPAQFLDTLDNEHLTEGAGASKIGGSKSFAFTNPIFIDVDGEGWEAKYVREGKSPL